MPRPRRNPPDTNIRPHDWLSPSDRGTTHLPDAMRREIGDPDMIPWISDANLIVIYNPNITLQEFELGLEIMKVDGSLRHHGKTDEELAPILTELKRLLEARDYDTLKKVLADVVAHETN